MPSLTASQDGPLATTTTRTITDPISHRPARSTDQVANVLGGRVRASATSGTAATPSPAR